MSEKTEKNENKHDKFSFIIYEGKRVPKYMQINPSTLKMVSFGAPFIVLLSLLALTSVFFYMDVLKSNAGKEQPSLINELTIKNNELEQSLAEKLELINELQQKQASLPSSTTATATAPTTIATTPDQSPTTSASNNHLGIFKTMLNVKDLSSNPQFNIEQITAFSDQKNLRVRFNIVNSNQNEKRSGHVWVFVRHGDEYQIYPAQNAGQEEFQFKYFDGEPFSTSRFRPVDATFRLPQKATDNILIKILIFNRSGDLIYQQVANKTLGI